MNDEQKKSNFTIEEEPNTPLWQKIINWTLTLALIIVIIWLISQKVYCNYTITPEQAIEIGKITIYNTTGG